MLPASAHTLLYLFHALQALKLALKQELLRQQASLLTSHHLAALGDSVPAGDARALEVGACMRCKIQSDHAWDTI